MVLGTEARPRSIGSGLVALALVVALDPTLRDPTYPKSVVLWGAALAVALCFAWGAFRGRGDRLLPLPAEAWLLCAALLWVPGLPTPAAPLSHEAWVALLDTASGTVLFLAALVLARKGGSRAVRPVAIALCLALVPALGYVALQGLGLDPVVWADAPGSARGTMGNRNLMAAVLVLALPLAIALARDPRTHRLLRALGAVAAAGAVVGLGVTRSQGAWLGVVMAGAIVPPTFLMMRRGFGAKGEGPGARVVGLRVRRVAALPIAAALCLACVGQASLGNHRGLVDEPPRAVEALASDDLDVNTLLVRLVLWGSAARATLERPWLGWGPGGFVPAFAQHRPRDVQLLHVAWNTRHAHSVLLEWAVEEGLPGALLRIAALACLLGRALTSIAEPSERRWPLALAASVAGALAHGCVGIALHTPGVGGLFWVLAGLLSGLLAGGPSGTAASGRVRRAGAAVIALALLALAYPLASLATRAWRTERLLVGAQSRIDADRASLALPLLEQAHVLLPKSLEVAYLLAFAELTVGRTDEALARYGEIDRICPAFAETRYNIGVGHYHAREFADAAAAFSSQLESALHSKAHLYLAASHLRTGRHDDGVAILEEMVDLSRIHLPSPGRRGYPHWVSIGHAHEELADLLVARGRAAEGLRHYEAADSCLLDYPYESALVDDNRSRLAAKIGALAR